MREKYRRKLEYIVEKMTDLPEPKNEYLIDALYYRVHTSIDMTMDIIAMILVMPLWLAFHQQLNALYGCSLYNHISGTLQE